MERLTDNQRDTMRDTADTLVLASACGGDTDAAMVAARTVLLSLVRPGCDAWVERLADDLEDTGPTVIDLLAA
jgi:hypothetical protein